MNIPIDDRSSETWMRITPDQKVVATDGGSRVDVFEGGAGTPAGPGHAHYWATFDQNGNLTGSGGRP